MLLLNMLKVSRYHWKCRRCHDIARQWWKCHDIAKYAESVTISLNNTESVTISLDNAESVTTNYTCAMLYHIEGFQQKCEDAKVIIKCYGKRKKTNDDLQNTTRKTEDWTRWIQFKKPRGQFGWFGMVSSSCSTSGTRRVTLVIITVISQEWRNDRNVITRRRTYPCLFLTQSWWRV